MLRWLAILARTLRSALRSRQDLTLEGIDPGGKTRYKLISIQKAKHAIKRVMRWNTIGQR